MDTALRRRFSFVEMMPNVVILQKIGADKVTVGEKTLDVVKMLEVINKRIEFLFDREHTIGHAFFASLKEHPSVDELAIIFEKKVLPLLQEYFYEDYGKIQLVLGDNAKTDDAYKFILDKKARVKDVFKGNALELEDSIEYEVQKSAFKHINSYIEIM